jgi:hypothetical protein
MSELSIEKALKNMKFLGIDSRTSFLNAVLRKSSPRPDALALL